MTIAQRSLILNFCKWSLDKLTQHYPEQTLAPRDVERIGKLTEIFKRWMTHEQQTPQLAFLRACDVLGLDPAEAKNELRKFLAV